MNLTVRQAWASMAVDGQPDGVIYRSVGTYRRSNGATTAGDYFWGQGPVGPDLPVGTPGVGMWSISGTV